MDYSKDEIERIVRIGQDIWKQYDQENGAPAELLTTIEQCLEVVKHYHPTGNDWLRGELTVYMWRVWSSHAPDNSVLNS